MGAMHFAIPDRSHLPPEAIARAYMAGMEGIPWYGESVETKAGFRLDRQTAESGELYLGWCVEGFGEVVLSTSTLLERTRPYLLPLELARGTINRLRNQLATWRVAGFEPSESLGSGMREVLAGLAVAATSQHQPETSVAQAQKVLEQGLQLIEQAAMEFGRQVLSMRQRKLMKLPTLLGGNLENRPLSEANAKKFSASFNTAVVPMTWRDLEPNEGQHAWDRSDRLYAWCAAAGMRVMAGPLLELSQQKLPDWLFLWDDDPHSLQSFLAQHVAAVVERYQGKTHLWHAMSRVNLGDLPALNEEDHLRLAVTVLETLNQTDGKTPVMVSFDQPWAEYVAQKPIDLSPLHFADALARAELGLAGLGLEINLGCWPGGTLPRDLLEFGRHLDRWSSLGLPLVVLLSMPSSHEPDPHCSGASRPLGRPLTAEQHAESVHKLVEFLLSKQAVQGVIWNQTHDRYAHEFPHGGLFDGEGHPKPVLDVLQSLRQQYLI